MARNVTVPEHRSTASSRTTVFSFLATLSAIRLHEGWIMRTNTIRLNSLAAAILLGMSLAVPATAGTVSSNAHSDVETNALANVRIDNFGRVNANYYRGAQPAGHDYADLQAVGIKTVIDLTDDGEAQEAAIVQGLGMKFYRIPMTTHETPSSEKIHEFLTLVNDPANQPVYVHCQGGRHRTGVMTAVYRMTDEGWTADRAFAEMKQYKFGMDFLHPEFTDFVMAYHPARDIAPAEQVVAALKQSPSHVAVNTGN
jgi:tyrosine-protein phosphatase SIW14